MEDNLQSTVHVLQRIFNQKNIFNKKLLIPSNEKKNTYSSLYTLMEKILKINVTSDTHSENQVITIFFRVDDGHCNDENGGN